MKEWSLSVLTRTAIYSPKGEFDDYKKNSKWINDIPNTVIDDDINMARSHTSAILKPVSRFVEPVRDCNGFLIPKYLPKLIKHICKILAEHASTSHVT